MKKVFVFFVLCLFGAAPLMAQDPQKQPSSQEPQAPQEFPQPKHMQPRHTEFWQPQPAVVTPGGPVSAPSDAIVLFDGSNLDEWTGPNGAAPGWKVEDGVVTIVPGTGEIMTKRSFGDCQLHIEWREPVGQEGASQERGNSGIFIQSRYEIQILDSYQNPTYVSGGAGSIYKQRAPLVNAMRPQGEWNVYDIIYEAPTFHKDGTFRTYPHVTVLHNGVLIQNHAEILGTTEYVGFPKQRLHGDAPLFLQDHGNPVSFRNIWIREL